MKLSGVKRFLPSRKNALLAVLSAILLILAFPDFEYWFLAWFALVPLLMAVERQSHCVAACFVLGWLFGFVFFSGTCWWLTYAPIHYAAFPWPLAYFLLFCVTAVVGIFPGIFAAITSILLRRFGSWAFLAVPFIWVATEFARYWITGNDWNAIGYSQAFVGLLIPPARIGGIYLLSFEIVFFAVAVLSLTKERGNRLWVAVAGIIFPIALPFLSLLGERPQSYTYAGEPLRYLQSSSVASIVAIQPNVPMAGLNYENWKQLRDRQVSMAESELLRNKGEGIRDKGQVPTTVILPESPMNYQWEEDEEFRQFISEFAAKNNVNVLFNSAEPDAANHKYFNSAVMIDASGREIAQYDKIYLLPFGEAVPAPLDSVLPGFVGNFSYGRNYDLVPLGDARAGIMICFESHFGQLSREYVRRGADAIIEMTNDGYLGPTPVLRQHLANAVFRAIETNRPVLRVTNVGITAYITERGEVLDATKPYTEDTRVWSVAKSDGSQTFYVRYGDWFAWVCLAVTVLLMLFGMLTRRAETRV
jgi:apolipoprotein N-acyltransferase